MTPAFNDLPAAEAERRLLACFAHRAWAARVAAGRPYRDLAGLLAAAESAWDTLKDGDWLGAFSAHPRIGESGGHAPEQSRREQSVVSQAHDSTLAELADGNRRYEERFGHVFLIAAHGRTADEILAELRQRMTNDPAAEIRVAANEQRKIARLRLEKMIQE